MEIQAGPYSVTCPRCGAVPLDRCRVVGTSLIAGLPHEERRRAADHSQPEATEGAQPLATHLTRASLLTLTPECPVCHSGPGRPCAGAPHGVVHTARAILTEIEIDPNDLTPHPSEVGSRDGNPQEGDTGQARDRGAGHPHPDR